MLFTALQWFHVCLKRGGKLTQFSVKEATPFFSEIWNDLTFFDSLERLCHVFLFRCLKYFYNWAFLDLDLRLLCNSANLKKTQNKTKASYWQLFLSL